MSIYKTTARTENDYQKVIYNDSGNIIDICDMTGLTPFQELLNKEEKAHLRGENREAQVEAVSALLAYIVKDKDPLQIVIRLFLLAYTINPSLIDGMTLEQIGKHLGGISKQRLSAKLKKQDAIIHYKGRNRKSDEQKKIYSEKQKEVWRKRKKLTTATSKCNK